MNSTTQFVSILILLLTLAAYLIITASLRRRRTLPPLRPLPAYDLLPLMVGESIEADRPLHLVVGGAGVGGRETPLTLAATELFYRIAQRSASGAIFPILSTSNTSALPLAQDTLRRAYASRDRLDRYDPTGARWLPADTQLLAFAAAVAATTGAERVAGSALVGAFGAELALPLDTAARRRLMTVAGSVQPEGQAVAYVMADRALIGEEVFTAGAYLGGGAGQVAVVAALDLLRWLVIVVIIVGTFDGLTEGALTRTFGGALGGLLQALGGILGGAARP